MRRLDIARGIRRGTALFGVGLALLVVLPGVASAHPLGNLSVNTFSRVVIAPDVISLDVVVDAAEIPTLQAFPTVNRRQGAIPQQERVAYEQERCAAIGNTITLAIDGARVAVDVGRTTLTFPPGSAGLRTSRLTCAFSSTGHVDTVDATVDYSIAANADRVGWREVIAVPSGVAFSDSDVPQDSVSNALTSYPKDLLTSPPDQREAHLLVEAGSVAAAGPLQDAPTSVLPRGVDRLTTAFTDLVARQDLSLGFGLLAVIAAMVLGALHAFAPGHGKTVMAAYLVGREGSFRQAAIVGLSVTATHTLGVLALGLALTGAGLASPELVYPWLGTLSGLLLAGIGVGLLVRHRKSTSGTSLAAAAESSGHDHDSDQSHHPDPTVRHRHGMFSHTHLPPARNIRGLIAIGFAGGLIPSPSALLVLLGGIALGRAWLGVLLVLAYGIGMAGALMAAGLLMVSARDAIGRLFERRGARPGGQRTALLLSRGLPAATAVVVVVVGLGIAVRSATQF